MGDGTRFRFGLSTGECTGEHVVMGREMAGEPVRPPPVLLPVTLPTPLAPVITHEGDVSLRMGRINFGLVAGDSASASN